MSALDRLADIVHEATAKIENNELQLKIDEVAAELRQAEANYHKASIEYQNAREVSQKALADIAEDAKRLDELVMRGKKLKLPELDAEIRTCRREIEDRRTAAISRIEPLGTAMRDARTKVDLLAQELERLKKETPTPRPMSPPRLAPYDALKQLHKTAHDSYEVFGRWHKQDQYWQLTVWIGMFRQIQDRYDEGTYVRQPGEDWRTYLKETYGKLVEFSHTHRPGAIEAFKKDFVPEIGWDEYIRNAQERLQEVRNRTRH